MATLHLMVGLPGSGKTTFAKKLAQQHNAVLFSPDDWQFKLFGNDINDPTHDENHTKIEELMWDVAQDILKTGTDVILDFGCWAKEGEFDRALYIRQKCYIEEINGKVEVTVAGLPKYLAPLITFDNFKRGFTTEGMSIEDMIREARKNGASKEEIEKRIN